MKNVFYQILPFVDYFLYGLLIFITGLVIYWLTAADIRIRLAHYRYRMRLKKKPINLTIKRMPRAPWFRHLYQLFAIRSTKADRVTVYGFLAFEGFIGLGVFVLILLRLQDFIIAMLCAGLTVLIPYLFLYVSAKTIRNEIGGAIQEVVQTIIHSYSASRGDMYTALSSTHKDLKHKEFKRVIARLISDLQTAHDEETLREIVDLFIFSTGNSWGMRLGNIILKAYVYQENVSSALLTLQQQMITHQKMMEEEKAEAVDVSLQGIVAVILFPVSLFGANYITNPQNWWVLQFGDPKALLSFVVTALFVGIAAVIAFLVQKPKNDL